MTEHLILMSDFPEFRQNALALLHPSLAPAGVVVIVLMPDGRCSNQSWAQSGSAALDLAAQLEFHAAEIRKAGVGLGDATKPGRTH